MKKIILSAAFLAFAGLATVQASEIKVPVVISAQQDSTTKTPVELKDLPDAVKATLSSDKYKEWIPTAAFLVTKADKSEHYLIDVKKGEETASLKIGKDGVVIE
ncbi:hypothetical protein FBD94_14015 [Pedobacter hiemivivus]|uniref:Uncharacterized protein n=1 Tax=Pedobacter hiemivivus TaxID=2530454 RepID=A0A4R0MSF6_9SPHI|nr:hypothetical protein [Pedobacter hiemivivus]TCC89587.1 hypothetical protein EZ444_20875 [Pedobacter hiemivivus]TKC60034.1 hypothetical protein FBD94_14015 [Pedobacter hiemivivus]